MENHFKNELIMSIFHHIWTSFLAAPFPKNKNVALHILDYLVKVIASLERLGKPNSPKECWPNFFDLNFRLCLCCVKGLGMYKWTFPFFYESFACSNGISPEEVGRATTLLLCEHWCIISWTLAGHELPKGHSDKAL